MKARQTLYELLGVAHDATQAEIQAAYRREAGNLDSLRPSMAPQQFTDRVQLLRVAFTTLSDPVSRLGYDTKLSDLAQATQPAASTRALALTEVNPHVASAEVRADALALRADALALRADAMLVRAGLDPDARGGGRTVASGAMLALKRFTRALGLLVLVGVVVFFGARMLMGGSAESRAAAETRASEQAALQEYYQTYGIRPANMAELELLEADRRRRENQERQAERDAEKQARDARSFEEEARRRAQEVSEQVRRTEEEAQRRADWERERQASEEREKQRAEQRRIEYEKAQWREVLRR